ncbi:MAG: hypothetical protein FWG18_00075 [Alphaproteobacteria bacterium]|nr:hypothetical protein [Alphaproteobacteria bacterium]
MKQLKIIFNAIFPFAITLVFWRLSTPFWNPCGILAMIPIFYYSFISPRSGFLPFALFICFLIDYNFDTMLFWTSMFAITYSANYFQTVLRVAVTRESGLWSFAAFMGACLVILGIAAFFTTWAFTALGQMIWIWALTVMGYFGWIKLGAKLTNN